GMLSDVDLHSRMKGKNDEFTRRIAREGDPPWTSRHADDKRHPGQNPADPALQRHHAHSRHVVFPQQHVMLEEYRIVLTEIDLRNGNDLALDLASASAKAYLGHVLDPRSLTPPGFAHQVFDVERRPARATRHSRLLIHRLAPLAMN